jgi:hypothetical protein
MKPENVPQELAEKALEVWSRTPGVTWQAMAVALAAVIPTACEMAHRAGAKAMRESAAEFSKLHAGNLRQAGHRARAEEMEFAERSIRNLPIPKVKL